MTKTPLIFAHAVAGLMLGACAAHVDEPAAHEDLGDEHASAQALPEDEAAYDDEEGEIGVVTEALIGPNDVGVLAPAGTNCPNEHIMLTLENERDGNNNAHGGWLGASTQDDSYTKLRFCRVDGRSFRPALSSTSSTSFNYAVLKLGNTCPAGSVDIERRFDNEDRPRGCPSWPLACAYGAPPTLGNYAPSYYDSNNLHLKLCMFRSSPSGSAKPTPYIGIPYGVFGTSSLQNRIATGVIHTDDEDDSNGNWLTGDTPGSEPFLTATTNTTLLLTEVNPPQPIVIGPIYTGTLATASF